MRFWIEVSISLRILVLWSGCNADVRGRLPAELPDAWLPR